MQIGVLVVRDNELDVGDDEVALSKVAEGGTCAGGGHTDGHGNNSRDGNGIFHVETRNWTFERLNLLGYCWICLASGTPDD